MKKALISLMLALNLVHGYPQTFSKNDPLKFDADYYLMEKDFTRALSTYQNILRSEPENADIKYKIGICYLNSENEKASAIPYLEDAVQKISEKHNPSSFKEMNAPVDALFLLGSAYRVNNQLNEAIGAYTRYREYLDPKDDYNLNVVEQYLRNCEMARSMQNNPINMITTNLGAPVNTAAPNFNAVVSGDGRTMLYTSPGRQGYDIFMTTFEDSAWTAPRNVTSVLGTGKYMMTSALSQDGLSLLLTLDDPMNADIYVSRYAKGRWSKTEQLSKEINSKYNETHASFSSDGKTLYFTSDRKGGSGDLDIYKSMIDEKGEWGKPENLGPAINTPFNEETPFITEAGDILYFSSEGHDGMGGYDIFRYDFNNPGAGAVNAGYPLNTTDNDLFFVPQGDGTSGYYAFSGKDSYGGRDIYRVFIEKKVEEPPVAEEPAFAETFPVTEEPAVPAEEEWVTENTVEPVTAEVSIPAEEQPVQEIAEEPAMVKEFIPPAIEETAEVIPVTVPEIEPASMASSDMTASSYRVQIMALKKPVDLTHFSRLEGVAVVYSGDKWYRYTLGNTNNRENAENLLAELIAKGYRDAFIRASGTYPQYTIQVMAVPGPVTDLKKFDNLPEITVVRGSDNFCRYSTGEYASKEDALHQLDRVKALGYRKAFVTRIKQ